MNALFGPRHGRPGALRCAQRTTGGQGRPSWWIECDVLAQPPGLQPRRRAQRGRPIRALPRELGLLAPEVPIRRGLLVDRAQ